MTFTCSLCGHALRNGTCVHCDRPCPNGARCPVCGSIRSLIISMNNRRV